MGYIMIDYKKKYLINKNSESSYQNDIAKPIDYDVNRNYTYRSKYYKYKKKYLNLKNKFEVGGGSMYNYNNAIKTFLDETVIKELGGQIEEDHGYYWIILEGMEK